MTQNQLLARIAEGEGPLCEWKALPQSDEVREAVVAFANTVRAPDAAVLFLGIGPNGQPSGTITNADKTQRSVVQWLSKCYPPIQFHVHKLVVGGLDAVAIEVPESKNGPHFSGPAFKRIGSQTVQASPEMFHEMIADRTETARLLRPWVGKPVRVEQEVQHHRSGRAWGGMIHERRLLSVDSLGLALDISAGAPLTVTWDQVILPPIDPARPPLIKIKLP